MGLLDPLAEYELIVPENIPGTTINSAQISEAATSFSTMAGTTREKGSAIKTTWSGLSAHYEAPESADLLAVMDPVETNSTVIADKFDRISTLLSTLADTVEPIKNRLVDLKAEAEAFRADVENGVLVSTKAAEQAGTGSGYYGTGSTYSGGTYISGTYVGGSSSATTTRTVAWHEDLATNSRNRTLIREVNAEVALLDAAQADCVNGLRALSTDPWKVPEAYVPMTEDALNQAGVELPWGAATRDIPCESSFGYGMASGLAGMYEGAAALVSFNAETGQWGDGDLFVGSWRGLGMTGAGVVLAANPGTWIQKLMPWDNRPQWAQDFENEALDTALGAGKSIVAWDMWGEDPAQAAGLVGVNAATFFIPGGAVVSGLKAGSAGARAASFLGHAADVIVPGGRLLTNTATNGLLHAGQGVRVLTETARSGLTSGISTARGLLAQSLHDVANQLPTVDVVPGASAVTPDGTMTTPTLPRVEVGTPGSGGDWLHNVADRVDGGGPSASQAVDVDGAGQRAEGTTTTSDGSSLDSGAASDSPNASATDSNGSDSNTGADSTTGTGSDANSGTANNGSAGNGPGNTGSASNGSTAAPVYDVPVLANPTDPPGPVRQFIDSGRDPLSTTDASGSGWNRKGDTPGQPAEVFYGAPHATHGSTSMPTLNADGSNAGTMSLVSDPQAPWGRDRDGTPLTQLGYEQRFVNSHNDWDRYPFNDGAVRGSRVAYHDMGALIRDYGSTLDRIGGTDGKYLGLRVDGVAATFEQRALPVSSLAQEYHAYNLNPAATLPTDWTIEVSRIVHGVGRVGGEIQLKFFDEFGKEVRVETVLNHPSGIMTS